MSSQIHVVWAFANASMHGVGNDPTYNNHSCFQTFPFPAGLTPNVPAVDHAGNVHAQGIAKAAKSLVEARDTWLNPAEWVEWVITPEESRAGFPKRAVAKPGKASELKKRTLTNLYNARPTWLVSLHDDLDQAVAAAYGWEWPLSDDEILRRLFDLNQTRAARAT